MESHFMVFLSECGRCGEKSYEKLASHGYCAHCNYSPDFDSGIDQYSEIPEWAIRALKGEGLLEKQPILEAVISKVKELQIL